MHRAPGPRSLLPLALVVLLAPALARSDSPITSIDLHLAYADVAEVARAREAQLDERTFAKLRDPATTFELRAAIVSALGWKVGGRPELVSGYRERLARATGSTEPTCAVDLFNLGYVMALADYLDTAGALPLLDRAAKLEPDDQAVAMVRAIVEAQGLMADTAKWCEVFRVADAVARGKWRTPMRAKAVAQVMRYMGDYRDSCNGQVAAADSKPPAPPESAAPPAPGSAERIAWLEQAVRSNPKDAEAWKQLGNDRYDAHQPREAIEAYDRYLALVPGNPDVLCDQASMYRELGQFRSAEERLRRALRAAPRHLNSLINLGVLLAFDLRQPGKAIPLWKKVIALGESEQAGRARMLIEQVTGKE